jgi:3-hydroxyacyl-CoA dehydrogenase
VLVVGAGQMGGGIAQVLAASGREVVLADPEPEPLTRALAAIRASLERLATRGGADPEAVLARVHPGGELLDASLPDDRGDRRARGGQTRALRARRPPARSRGSVRLGALRALPALLPQLEAAELGREPGRGFYVYARAGEGTSRHG